MSIERLKLDGNNIIHEWGTLDALSPDEKYLIVTVIAGIGDEILNEAFRGSGPGFRQALEKALTTAYLLGKNQNEH